MAKERRHYGRQPSEYFGRHLKRWRKAVPLTLEEAAPLLGLGGTDPGAYLSVIERGTRPIPEVALLEVSQVYGVSPEEVIRRAYWPQLTLPLLTTIMDPTELPQAIKVQLRRLVDQLNEDEKKELTRYAALLLLRRHMVRKSSP